MVKVLVAGDILGNFAPLVDRVDKIHSSKAGPFDVLFCVGNTFGKQGVAQLAAYISGEKKFPLPTYALIGGSDLPDGLNLSPTTGGELCHNFTILGEAGVREIAGLRVAFLSLSEPSSADVTTVTQNADTPVDLLLTAKWGSGFHHCLSSVDGLPASLQSVPTAVLATLGSERVAMVASRIKTQYHFAGTQGLYFPLPPYQIMNGPVTRFYGMGCVGDKNNKWVSAFNIKPCTQEQLAKNSDASPCPYTQEPVVLSLKRRVPSGGIDDSMHPARTKALKQNPIERKAFHTIEQEEGDHRPQYARYDTERAPPPPGYICRRCNIKGHYISECRMTDEERGPPPASYVCRKCDQPGHWITNCPLIAEEKSTNRVGRVNGMPEGYVCKVCNEPGHFIRDCPVVAAERAANVTKPVPADYTCKRCSVQGQHWVRQCPQPKPPPGPDYECKLCRTKGQHWVRDCPQMSKECWFCLGSTDVATHLLVSIGAECYIAQPKGILLPDHCLLLPVQHMASVTALSGSAREEMNAFQACLRLYAKSQNKHVVFVERYFPLTSRIAQHTFIECFMLTPEQADQAQMVFESEGKTCALTFTEHPSTTTITELVQPSQYYVHVTLGDGRQLLHIEQSEQQVDRALLRSRMSLGRRAVAHIIGQPKLADWRLCEQNITQETAACDSFKALFAPFDTVSVDSDDDDDDDM